MEIKQLDKLAKEKAPMPSGLPLHEQCYYIASRGLYAQYDQKIITLEEAKREKQHVIEQFNLEKGQWELFVGIHEVADKLKRLQKDPFNTALELEVLELIDQLLK